jgi:hypothetical protein
MHPGLPHKKGNVVWAGSCEMIRIVRPVLGWLPQYRAGRLLYSDAVSVQGTSEFSHVGEFEPAMEEKGRRIDLADGWENFGVSQQH